MSSDAFFSGFLSAGVLWAEANGVAPFMYLIIFGLVAYVVASLVAFIMNRV